MSVAEEPGVAARAVRSRPAWVEPRLLSPDDAATYLGLGSRWAVYRLITRGELRPIRLARKLRLDRRDLDALIDAAKDALAAEAPSKPPATCPVRTLPQDLRPFEHLAPRRSPAKPPQLHSAPRGP